ncbi:TerB family tellurite resistance protein [Aestuariispira insulae]|uniref:DnaJ like chaperone protein n=1 Tax=Aestuariispira insulae TaxID=1461337 RepID=A0A3D9HJH3_9PROT|nr:TerB family tellurite resistance protein [Aestuariispira insulae]RED49650.1 DnaJ like chaperone protein [Aestuariispira insulae]
MSIWGKILGGVGGLALGGPLGALIGALGGHVIDSMQPDKPEQKDGTKTVAFTIAVIVLGAKMAKADGRVTRDEVNAFKQVLRIPPEEMKNVSRLFDQAKKDSRGFEPYAKQMADMFAKNPEVLEELLWCLTHIAKADGHIHPGELEYLYKVSEIFGFEGLAFERVTGLCQQGESADPYTLLGISKNADDDAIKAAHRKQVMEHHPDRLVAQGMPEEFVELANEKLAKVNAAYDRIKAERGLR